MDKYERDCQKIEQYLKKLHKQLKDCNKAFLKQKSEIEELKKIVNKKKRAESLRQTVLLKEQNKSLKKLFNL